MKRAIIFCSGEMDTDAVWKPEYRDALILCADGGLRHAKRLGITPDCIIGDLDSVREECLPSVQRIVHPPEKDATDTNLCLDYAIEKGCTEVLLLGGTGGRLDHEYSHYALLLYGLRRGVRVRMINGQNEVFMENRPFTLHRNEKRYVSFFPFGGDVENFTVRGLRYEAVGITLRCDMAQASSNQFEEGNDDASVSFQKGGTLLVIRSCDL